MSRNVQTELCRFLLDVLQHVGQFVAVAVHNGYVVRIVGVGEVVPVKLIPQFVRVRSRIQSIA